MKKIPVFLPSDNNYAPYLATMIVSILDNTESEINFYILDSGINQENREKISSLKNKFQNFSIEFLNVDVEKYFNDFTVEKVYTKSTYNRFLIPKLKPELKKAIYLDTDMMALDDIKKLYDTDLEGFALGAVPEDNLHPLVIQRKLNLNLQNHTYFNSGALLIDIQKWVKNDIAGMLFETEKLYRNKLQWADQDCLNLVFKNDYKPLDNTYNCVASNAFFNPDKKVAIRHFNSFVKPWKLPEGTQNEIFPDLDIFWKYAKLTSFYDKMKQDAEGSKISALRHCQIYKISLLKYKREQEQNEIVEKDILAEK